MYESGVFIAQFTSLQTIIFLFRQHDTIKRNVNTILHKISQNFVPKICLTRPPES
jgi:hypothetical protein